MVTPTPSTVIGTVPKAQTVTVAAVYRHGDPAAGKVVFTKVGGCGSCHTLADAGTNGKVGPVLDQLKPDKARVLNAIKNGGTGSGTMPAGIVTGKEAAAVAEYVSSVAGK